MKHSTTHEDVIRDVLGRVADLDADPKSINDTDDLYDAGLNSHASVRLMLGLEEAFEVEFPETALRKSTFASIEAIKAALVRLDAHV
ncbi:acyl carrier protein [Rhodococcus sp. P1Y]|uniref:acyl carrier protein n=1 Tax=Rhodococcus sp. P1Y TaxID=1302308 RepID=UPI000EB1712C|nr:acyl carrier protein [Rhodococcus sp. P1Y]AYJ48175.1 acyl carrier protein [Rhodococcus sp. P1Y]